MIIGGIKIKGSTLRFWSESENRIMDTLWFFRFSNSLKNRPLLPLNFMYKVLTKEIKNLILANAWLHSYEASFNSISLHSFIQHVKPIKFTNWMLHFISSVFSYTKKCENSNFIFIFIITKNYVIIWHVMQH